MTLNERVFAQALTLAGELNQRQTALLAVLCQGATRSLAAQLRKGLTPEDCMADFLAASSLIALAALTEAGEPESVERFTAGDVTIQKGRNTAAGNCLRYQARVMMMPYLRDPFTFQGV